MNPLDFLRVAIRFKDSKEEAERRTSVSRAYFAVYNQVKAFFNSNRVSIPKDASGHVIVVRYLRQSQVAGDIGGRIDDLRTYRNDADYKLEKDIFNVSTVVSMVSEAEEVVADFQKVDGKVLLSEVKQYIREIQP